MVAAERRVGDVLDRAQIGGELLDHGRRQVPRVLVDVVEEPLHAAQTLLDRGELEVARQLLVAPAVEHQLEHLLVRAEDRHRLHQLDSP